MTEKRMYLVRQAEPDKKYPVTQRDMMKEATRLRAIDGRTVSLHVEVGPFESPPAQPEEAPKRGRKKGDNSLISPVDAEPRTEPMSSHAESSGGQAPTETDHAQGHSPPFGDPT